MMTKYITDSVNKYGQVNLYEQLEKVKELIKFRFYHTAINIIDELYEVYSGTQFDNINSDLVVFTFDEECEMFLYIDILSKKLNVSRETYKRKWGKKTYGNFKGI